MGLASLPAVLSMVAQACGRVWQRSARLLVGLLLAVLVALSYGCSSAPPAMPSVVADTHRAARAEFPYRDAEHRQRSMVSGMGSGRCVEYSVTVVRLLAERGVEGHISVDRHARPFRHATVFAVVDGRVWVFDVDERWPVPGPDVPRFDELPIDF